MPLFECENCGNVDNTATAPAVMRTLRGKTMWCRRCLTGKWHNQFKEQKVTEEMILNGEILYVMAGDRQIYLSCVACNLRRDIGCKRAFKSRHTDGRCMNQLEHDEYLKTRVIDRGIGR